MRWNTRLEQTWPLHIWDLIIIVSPDPQHLIAMSRYNADTTTTKFPFKKWRGKCVHWKCCAGARFNFESLGWTGYFTKENIQLKLAFWKLDEVFFIDWLHSRLILLRKSKDYVYGIWVYKVLGVWKGYYRVKKSLVSCMKPWTEARNNKYMKYHSKLTYQLSVMDWWQW